MTIRYVGMHVLEPPAGTENDNPLVDVMTDKYNKLTRAILTSKTNTTTAARIYLEHLVPHLGFSWKILTDNGSYFVSTFLWL